MVKLPELSLVAVFVLPKNTVGLEACGVESGLKVIGSAVAVPFTSATLPVTTLIAADAETARKRKRDEISFCITKKAVRASLRTAHATSTKD